MPILKNRYDGLKVHEVTWYTLNRKDIIQLWDVYILMHEWLIEHDYASREDKSFPEVYMMHKDLPAGKEMWWRWRPSRYPLGPNNDRYRFDLNLDCHVLLLKEVEAVIAGKKIKTYQGEFELQCRAMLVEDPAGTFEKSFLKDFKKLLYGRVWKQQFEMLRDDLRKDSFLLRDAVAQFLQIETYQPVKELPGFWPKRIPE